MKIKKYFTKKIKTPYSDITFEKRQSLVRKVDGSESSHYTITVPSSWSQVASDILAQNYARKAGVPETEHENDARQIFHRMALCWKTWGEKGNYFDSPEDAQNFYDEICYMLAHQMAAPNTPQWLNTGLHSAYGITGEAQGHYYTEDNVVKRSTSAYERPQPSACFIQSVHDDLVNEGGIMDLWVKEARLFKYGSGSGTNFSHIRGKGEKLSGGGHSSGLISFLKVGDKAAGAIKSGGTTRRAAKMVCLDLDHPDIEEFIAWKSKEESKVAALVTGSKIQKKYLTDIFHAYKEDIPNKTQMVKDAISVGVTYGMIDRAIKLSKENLTEFPVEEFDLDYRGEAYDTVAGQHANNSIRIPNKFFTILENNGDWECLSRVDGSVIKKIPAQKLWNSISLSAWECADPGIQFDDTINEWHTCINDGRINASNPCSEYMFLDNTACNLASLNLIKFFNKETGEFLVEDYEYSIRLWTIVLEISVFMAQYPSESIALGSYNYRTLGLGYANLGSLLMVKGLAYNSEEGRNFAAILTSILTATSYKTSAEMAKELGPFVRYEFNKDSMLKVIRNHQRAAISDVSTYEGLTILPKNISLEYISDTKLLESSKKNWQEALSLGQKYGFRNAQVTVVAPTGTIGLVMDCDTTGIEPDFALVKFKKISSGGYLKIINQSVPAALKNLGYTENQIKEIILYATGTSKLNHPLLNKEVLLNKGFLADEIERIENQLPFVLDISQAFSSYILGEYFLARLNLKPNDILKHLNLDNINDINHFICGRLTVEGAPFLKEEHYKVFDCAAKCGREGKRFITWDGHVKMLAATQPFISGSISKTINMVNESTLEDIQQAYKLSWQLMLKCNAIYRDGSKLSQVLQSSFQEEVPNDFFQESPLIQSEKMATILDRGFRKTLPKRRAGITQKAYVGGHKVYLRTGEYPDGSLGEIFIDMYREGAGYKSLMSCFAISVSLGLQYGVPLEEFVEAFVHTKFEPNGIVMGHDQVKLSTSIVDYIFRDLAYNYLNRKDLVQIPDSFDETDILPLLNKQKTEEHIHLSAVQEAKIKGFESESCNNCMSYSLRRNGTCLKCDNCGTTTGCS